MSGARRNACGAFAQAAQDFPRVQPFPVAVAPGHLHRVIPHHLRRHEFVLPGDIIRGRGARIRTHQYRLAGAPCARAAVPERLQGALPDVPVRPLEFHRRFGGALETCELHRAGL